jgi:AAA15 family ATPase/GTPase
MIQYIKIKNFGPIREEVELSFEALESDGSDAYEISMPDKRKLLKLAYIYGANASGKTTILRGFEFLRDLWLNPAYQKDEALKYDPFLFCPNPEEYPSGIELAFYVDGIRYIYNLSFSKQAIISEKMVFYRTIQPTELFSRSTDLDKRVSYIEFGSQVKVAQKEKDSLQSVTLYNNTVLGAFEKANVDIPELEKLNKWAIASFMPMINSGTDLTGWTATKISDNPSLGKWMNTFLNKADKNIREVTVRVDREYLPKDIFSSIVQDPNVNKEQIRRMRDGVVTRSEINFVHGTQNDSHYQLPIEKESSGSKRYFGLGGILYQALTNPGFVCIDELDTSLHADLMKYFLQLFLLNSENSQMLITTHNLFLLEEQDFVRKDALWFSEKGENGEVSLYSAADFDSSTLRKGASLINAYKSGRLGAKPNLGSPYLKLD